MIANPTIGQQSTVDYVSGDGIGIAQRTTGLLGAAVVTMGLIFTMTKLISNDLPTLEEEKSIVVPTFHFVPDDQEPNVIEVKPLELKAPPPRLKIDYSSPNAVIPVALALQDPEPIIDFNDDNAFGLPGGSLLVPIEPQYPEPAAQRGLCGFVVLQYDISADGIPTNVAVLDSSSRLFNKSAVRAVQRARYKPHTEGGKPVMVQGKQEKISYKLEGGC